MSRYLKSLLYLAGTTLVGVGLFTALTPSTEYAKEINSKQGMLTRDKINQQKETELLISRLRTEAGYKPVNKS